MMIFKPIAATRESDDPEPIQIRVLKKWIPHNQNTDLCYLFIDENGDAIHVVCLLEDEKYFDKLITVQSCYIVDEYIPIPQHTYMPAISNETSLLIGQRTTFKCVNNINIPDHYYNFATYNDLESRVELPRMLTDYIGVIVDDGFRPTKKGRPKIVTIRDESNNELEITFWPKQQPLLPKIITHGDILAITGTTVSKYMGNLQLESTPASTLQINPTTPDTSEYVTRLQNISRTALTQIKNLITIKELKEKTKEEIAEKNHFSCVASIKGFKEKKPWFYVTCSKCNKRMICRKQTTIKYLCRNHVDSTPRFMYCVNATITDKIADVDVVFFDEAMTSLLKISCEEMITNYGEDYPLTIPKKFVEAMTENYLLSITMTDRTIAVNKTSDPKKFSLRLPTSTARSPPLALPQPPKTIVQPPATPAKRSLNEPKEKTNASKQITEPGFKKEKLHED